MARRAPGRDKSSTPRKESDTPHILSGLLDGVLTGAPLAAVIENTNTRSKDYSELKVHPRPGHADYTASVRYKKRQRYSRRRSFFRTAHRLHGVCRGGMPPAFGKARQN